MKRFFGLLRDLSFDKGCVTIHWSNDTTSTVPLIWMRDNPQDGARSVLPPSLKLKNITLDEHKDTLIIKWNDRPADSYTGPWLHQKLFPSSPTQKQVTKHPLTDGVLDKIGATTVEIIETLEKYGGVIVRKDWEMRDVWDVRVVSGGRGLRTEGVYLPQVPRVLMLPGETVDVTDCLHIQSHLTPSFAQHPASFSYRVPNVSYRSSHPLLSLSPLSIAYNEFYRDSTILDKEFYALLGHFQQIIGKIPSIRLSIPRNSLLLVDNHRLLTASESISGEIRAFSSSLYTAIRTGLGISS